ncbi:hypothetical protein V8E53_014204 [Lactarius tabidus]
MSSHLLKTFRVSILQWTISTVINNPHKKSAPPKVHASVLPAPRIELPCVRRKDFPPYFFVIGSEWESFLHNLILGRAASTHLEQPNLDGPPDTLCTPCPPKLLPPLSSIPQIFFNPNFDLGDCRTFDTVAEVPSSSSPSSSHPPSALPTSSPSLKSSHTMPTHSSNTSFARSRRAMCFFAALSNLQDLQAESARYLARVQSLHAQLTAVRENSMHCRLCGVHCEVHLAHLRDVQVGIHAILGVVETVGVIRGLVNGREWGTALDGVDELHAGTRIQLGRSLSDDHTEMTDGLRPLIQGLVQTRNLRESVVWRDVVLGEVQGTVQQHVHLFDPADDPQKEPTDASWISSLHSMTRQEFQSVLCSILKTFLNCVEGLRTLNSNITQVLEDIRPPASPSELTVIHDSLFDTLSSSAESANMSISKVISAQADQHVKLDFCEFLETFNECWNFVAKSFLKAFCQARISQSTKLVEDE